VQILHAIYPPCNFLRLFVSAFDTVYVHWSGSHNIFALHIFQFENCFVLTVKSRLIQLSYTQIFLCTIWLWHFQESVYLTNCWYIIRNKWLQFGLKIYFLGFISRDVFEQFFDIVGNLQLSIVIWVISSWNFFFISIFFFFIVASLLLKSHWFLTSSALLRCSLLLLLYLLLLYLTASCLSRSIILHWVDFIIIFVGFYLFTIIDIYRQIIWLIIQLFTLNVFLGSGFVTRTLFVLLLSFHHFLRIVFLLIDVFTVIKVLVIEVELFSSLLCKMSSLLIAFALITVHCMNLNLKVEL
jgi:hypothetical protein